MSAVPSWVVVVFHHPPYSCSTNHGSDEELRMAWQPIFDEHSVDLVFTGHDHDYERSKPIRGFQAGSNDGELVAPGEDGTVYVVAAGAGAPLYGVDPSCYHTETTESVRNYVIVDVEGNTLDFTAYRIDGTVLDEFTLTK